MIAGNFRETGYAKTIGYFAALVALGMVIASIGPALGGLAANTGSTLAAVSGLFVAFRLGYLSGNFFGGRLLDRLSGHLVLGAALLSLAAAAFSLPLLPSLPLLLAITGFLGFAAGIVEVSGNTLLVWVHGRNAGPFMNALHFFFGVGAMIAPLLIGWSLSATGGLTLAYGVIAAMIVPGAFFVTVIPSPAAPAAPEGTHPEQAGRTGTLLLFALLLLLYVGAEAGFGGWIAAYAVAAGVSPAGSAAFLASLFWTAVTAGRLIGIPLSVRMSPHALLVLDVCGTGIGAGLLLTAPRSEPVLWIATGLIGLSMATFVPAALSLAGRHLTLTGAASRWLFIGGGIGGMTVPWLIGQGFERIGPVILTGSILTLAAAMGAIVAVLFASIRRRPEAAEGR